MLPKNTCTICKPLYNLDMRNRHFFLVLLVLALMVLVIGQPVAAQSTDGRYFKETNKWVKGEFLKFYLQAPDPSLLYGLPISNEMIDSTGRKVQYFERARFELVLTSKGPEVKLSNLGKMLVENQASVTDFPGYSPTCRYFPKTYKSVCYDFLKFYDKYNGTVYFGDPITNMEYRDGGYVQYFENARLEFRAYLPSGQTIKIADLGRIAYRQYVGDVPPEPGSNIPTNLDALINGTHVHAFVSRSLVEAGSKQSVFVVVHDRQSAGSKSARVNVVLEYPSGRRELLSNGEVNADGIFQAGFTVGALNVNDVIKVLVQAEYMGVTFNTSSWFRVWY